MSNTGPQALTGSLEALLALLRRHTGRLPPAGDLALLVGRLTEQTFQHQGRLENINVQCRRALIRGVCELGPLLSRLDSQLQRASSATDQLARATDAAFSAAVLGKHLRLGVSEVQQLSAAAALLLGSGAAALERATSTAAPAYELITSHVAIAQNRHSGALAAVQACDVDGMQLAGALPGFAPAATARWLGALGAAVCHEASRPGGCGLFIFQGSFCELARKFLTIFDPQSRAGFPEVQAAASSSPALQQQLASTVQHCLQSSTALVLQHAQSGGADSASADVRRFWQTCTDALVLATSRALLPVMQRQVQPPHVQAALWPLAFRLAEQLPAQPPAGVPADNHALLWAQLLLFIGNVLPAAADTEQGLQAALRTRLVSLFPRAAAALRALAGRPDVGDTVADLFDGVAACSASVTTAAPATAEQLGALLTAADAALRLLPLVAQHAAPPTGETGSPGSSAAAEGDVVDAASELLHHAFDQVLRNASVGCNFLAGLQRQPCTPASEQPHAATLVQLLPHAMQLHGSACRLVHWAAQLPAAQQRPVLNSLHCWPGKHSLLSDAHGLALRCSNAMEEPSFRRQLFGADAAYTEAYLIIRSLAGWGARSNCAFTRSATAAGIFTCLPDPLTATMDPEVLAELRSALAPLEHPAGDVQSSLALPLINSAVRSPILCSVLLQDGTLQRLLSAHAALPDVQERALGIVTTLFACAQQAAAGAASEQLAQQLAQQLRSAAEAFESDFESSVTRAPVDWLAAAQPGSTHPAITVARLLEQHWQSPAQQAAARLELAHIAATRPCAYLRCANLGAEAGPEPGRQPGSQRCGGCKAVRYCGTACSHTDWRGPLGHRRVCAALAAERAAELAAGQAAST